MEELFGMLLILALLFGFIPWCIVVVLAVFGVFATIWEGICIMFIVFAIVCLFKGGV